MRVRRGVLLHSPIACPDSALIALHEPWELTTNKYHASQLDNKSSPIKKGGGPKATSDNNANKENNNAKNHSAHEEEFYTAEDDATIVAMKALPGKSWNDIKEAIGKPSVSQLKEHYKLHLGPNAAEEQKKQAERSAKAEKNKVEGLAKQVEGQGKNGDGGSGDAGEKGSGGGGGGDGGKKEKGGDGKNKGKEKVTEQAQAQHVCSLIPLDDRHIL